MLVRESIRITPDPREQPDVWTSTALDLRLHQTLAYWENTVHKLSTSLTMDARLETMTSIKGDR